MRLLIILALFIENTIGFLGEATQQCMPPHLSQGYRGSDRGSECSLRQYNDSRKTDLWIVGAGTLGSLVAKQWMCDNPNAKVIAETLTTANHDILRGYGVIPRLRSDR